MTDDRHDIGAWSVTTSNMSLRDYFAGQALAGWIAMHADHGSDAPSPNNTAATACRFADAMLKAREEA